MTVSATSITRQHRPVTTSPNRRVTPSSQSIAIYSLLAAGALAASASVGQLRVVDLAISCIVVVAAMVLAMRDAFHLPTLVIGVWIFQPLVRRLVDWQSGGYTSLTVLSLLPMLATAALLVPVWTRASELSRRLLNALWLLLIPVAVAAVMGVVRYGASAAPEAGGFLLPLLFLPYFASRPLNEAERRRLMRAAVLMCAVSAAYAWWQYLTMPSWDRMWLIGSGMESSMGRAEAGQMRVWGSLNSTGAAAIVWALALLAAFADRRWNALLRWTAAGLIATALMLTLARIAWLMVAGGLLAFMAFTTGRERQRAVVALAIGALGVAAAVVFLPGGERIAARAMTFGDLSADNSYRARVSILQTMTNAILAEPFGIGLGSKSAGKLSGSSTAVTAADNGYADLLLTFGVPGAIMFCAGLVDLARQTARIRTSANSTAWPALSLASGAALCVGTLSMLMFGGIGGMWLWLIAGLAFSGAGQNPMPGRLGISGGE